MDASHRKFSRMDKLKYEAAPLYPGAVRVNRPPHREKSLGLNRRRTLIAALSGISRFESGEDSFAFIIKDAS
ncbi:MAG: hypothetical protein B6D71_10750 [gamma proteobacterium symbiont of Stewartia floridana]|nr:MAG: hypothetical protein B6D71_10750 [gamma proteobacterium symbiont of Stewartia floridana]